MIAQVRHVKSKWEEKFGEMNRLNVNVPKVLFVLAPLCENRTLNRIGESTCRHNEHTGFAHYFSVRFLTYGETQEEALSTW